MSLRATCCSCASGCAALTDCRALLCIPHCHSVFESHENRNTGLTDVATSLRPRVNPDPCGLLPPQPPICPSDGRGARATGRHQGQQMVPVQSGCSQRSRDPWLHRTQQTLPVLQRSVCVCVCVVTKFLFDADRPPFAVVKILKQVEPQTESLLGPSELCVSKRKKWFRVCCCCGCATPLKSEFSGNLPNSVNKQHFSCDASKLHTFDLFN